VRRFPAQASGLVRSRWRPVEHSRPIAVRVILFMILVLAVPIHVAANPIDPTWQPGLYDDADADQLVTRTLSPEGIIGLGVLVLACPVSRACPVDEIVNEYEIRSRQEPVPRAPPGPNATIQPWSFIDVTRLRHKHLPPALLLVGSLVCPEYLYPSMRTSMGRAEGAPRVAYMSSLTTRVFAWTNE
jgi:hypothetical protein